MFYDDAHWVEQILFTASFFGMSSAQFAGSTNLNILIKVIEQIADYADTPNSGESRNLKMEKKYFTTVEPYKSLDYRIYSKGRIIR